MKVLILGADGMLGHIVKLYFLEQGHEVRGTSLAGQSDYLFDATKNLKDLEKFIKDFQPQAIINCIGLLNQVAENNKALAVLLNSYLPHYVDELARHYKIKFVHVSTDCVFDGKTGEYTEDSFKDATSFYGQSKALGELNNGSSITLRTSIVGPDINDRGVGLFQWFMNQTTETKGFSKVIWTGVTTLQYAKCMEQAITHNLTGLRHAVNNQKISKYELLKLFKKHFKKDIKITPEEETKSNKSLIRTTDFDFKIPSYDQMVQEMDVWVKTHPELYSKNQGGSQ